VADGFGSHRQLWVLLLTKLQIVVALAERYIHSRQVSTALAKELRTHLDDLRALAEKIRDTSAEASGALRPPVRATASPFVASRLKFISNNDGSAHVFIDDEPPFRMPRGLAAFLQHLVSGPVSPKDGLLDWHSRDSLLQWLCAYGGREFKPGYVKQRVYALRKCLRDAGIRRHLVHTDNALGVRFALRPGPVDAAPPAVCTAPGH
jgi:hypothetical protein